jgi:hypothetical protein
MLALVAIGLTFVATGVQLIAYLRQDDPITPVDLVMLIASFVLGLSIGACLFGIATLIRHQYCTAEALRKVQAAMTDQFAQMATPPSPNFRPGASPANAPPALDVKSIDSLLILLAEIRDNSLLTDAQRKERFTRLMVRHRKAQTAVFDAHLDQRQFHLADQILTQLADRFGQDQELTRLADRLDQARRLVQADELATAKAQVEEFLRTNAWNRAEQVAGDLCQRHPDLELAQGLLQAVRKQKTAFLAQQRARLLDEIQQFTQRREWQAALKSARSLVAAHPESPEAETVNAQMEILEANAEVAHRQALEARITDLVKRHQYSSAIEVAEHLVSVYPSSPQAEILRGQLPKLRGLAENMAWDPASSTG